MQLPDRVILTYMTLPQGDESLQIVRAMDALRRAGFPDGELARLFGISLESARLQSLSCRLLLITALSQAVKGSYSGKPQHIQQPWSVEDWLPAIHTYLNTFRRSDTGRPSMDCPLGTFSLAHTSTHAFCAFYGCSEGAIGVDAEPMARSVSRWQALSQRFLTAGEQRLVQDEASFLRLWIKKEALAKAYGTGLGDAARIDTLSVAPECFWQDTVENCAVSICLLPQ